MQRSRLPALFLVPLLFASLATAADDLSPRPLAPVQRGFVASAPTVLPYAPDRVLVQFTPEAMSRSRLAIPAEKGAAAPGARTGLARVDDLLRRHGVKSVERPYHASTDKAAARAAGKDRWFLLRLDGRAGAADLARALGAADEVAAVSLDWRAFPMAVPSDPLYTDHWGHHNTGQLPSYDWGGTWDHTGPPVGTVGFDANAEQAWDGSQGYGDSGTIVAILDSGVDLDHPDLAANLVSGYDFGDDDSDPDDDSADPGHGTCCAGVAASVRNSIGSVGIAAGCRIMPCKVADHNGDMYFSYIQDALYWAADHGADVVSMSFGAAISSDAATDAALQYAHDAGVTLVAATGNENASTISYPAINQYVIGVGAASPCGERKRSSNSTSEVNPGVNTDPNGYTCDGERWWGSNYGSTVKDAAGAVDVIAPTILPTTDIAGSGGYDSGDYDPFFNGTSCATPYTAGVCALIKSVHPAWTPAQVRDQLCNTAQDVVSVESGSGWDRYTGYGMVDAAAAVESGGTPTPPTADFTGDPTSGDAPLTVQFTDRSTGSPTSWSWDFGDGGTSTAQNPSHTYDSAGTYTVSLTVGNADGSDTATRTDYITVTEPSGGAWVTITYDDFENGFGNYTDGGGDCSLYTGGTYAHQGSNAADIQDNSGVASSFYHTNGYDVTGYSDLEVEFWYEPVSMDRTGEDFWVQYYDGSAWQTVAVFDKGVDFENGNFYHAVVSIPKSDYAYPTDARLRFMCDASGNKDDVYIDEITFRGYSDSGPPEPPTADFAGDPTSGDAPLTVQFTDRSTGSPTSWSWDFGDGGTSTAQNPSHTYGSAGTYTVSLTVGNAGGSDTATRTDYITVTAPAGGTWITLTYDDFEGGFGNYTDGGGDCSLYTGGTYAHQGSNAADIQDNSGVASSFYHTDGIDVSGYAGLEVEFWYYPRSMDRPGEDFWVQYYDGSAWQTVAVFDKGTDFENNSFYHVVVPIPKSDYAYPTDARLRFMCDASGNADDIYIDEVEFRGQAPAAGGAGPDRPAKALPARLTVAPNRPNPFNPRTTIEFGLPAASHVRVTVFDLMGRQVAVLADGEFPAGFHAVQWDGSRSASGTYFYRVQAGHEVRVGRMQLVK